MKSINWIDRLIAEKKLPSDRQAALMLGMSVTTLSSHRVGRLTTLDDKYAHRIEQELGLPDGAVILDQHMEREKDPAMKSVWQHLGKLVANGAGVAVVALAAWGLSLLPNRVEAEEISYNSNTYHTIDYTHKILGVIRRIRRAWSTLTSQLYRSVNPWISMSYSAFPA